MENLPLPTRCGSLANSTRLREPPNVTLALRALQELQFNPKPTTPAQTNYPLTLEEYHYLLDVLPDLKDIRRVWGQYRYESKPTFYKL